MGNIEDTLSRRAGAHTDIQTASPAVGFLSGFMPTYIAGREQARMETNQANETARLEAKKTQEDADSLAKEKQKRQVILSKSGADIWNTFMGKIQQPGAAPMAPFQAGVPYAREELAGVANLARQAASERDAKMKSEAAVKKAGIAAEAKKNAYAKQGQILARRSDLELEKNKVLDKISIMGDDGYRLQPQLTSIIREINHLNEIEASLYGDIYGHQSDGSAETDVPQPMSTNNISDAELQALFSD